MKKRSQWIIFMLLSMFLVACQPGIQEEMPKEDPKTIAELEEALAEKNKENWNLYIVLYRHGLRGIHNDPLSKESPELYTFYDVDADGIGELMTANRNDKGELVLIHLYYLLHQTKPQRLASRDEIETLKQSFEVFTDGTILTIIEYKTHDYVIVELFEKTENNTGLQSLDSIRLDSRYNPKKVPFIRGKEKINLENLTWYDFEEIIEEIN